MKRHRVDCSLRSGLLVFGLAFAALIPTANELRAQQSDLELGGYDPYGTFSEVDKLKIEHLYLPWLDIDLDSLDTADEYAVKRGRRILVTIEPWSWLPERRISASTLYGDLMSGSYDGLIGQICTKLSGLQSPVTVRWGHEMDIANRRYPWSRWSPEQYVEAYKYFVDQCRESATNLKYMWSPRGEVDLGDYYPGPEYVDVVGVSIFGLQQLDQDQFGRNRPFRELLSPVYESVTEYGKPISVAEYGCRGDEQYMIDCYRELAATREMFPELKSVVYFNEKETYPWPSPYGLPDWRVPDTFFSERTAASEQLPRQAVVEQDPKK